MKKGKKARKKHLTRLSSILQEIIKQKMIQEKEVAIKLYENKTKLSQELFCDVCSTEIELGDYINYHFFTLEDRGKHLEDVVGKICYKCVNNTLAVKEYKKSLYKQIIEKYKGKYENSNK